MYLGILGNAGRIREVNGACVFIFLVAALPFVGLAFASSLFVVVLSLSALSFGTVLFQTSVAWPMLLVYGNLVADCGAGVCVVAIVFKYAVVRARWPQISSLGF